MNTRAFFKVAVLGLLAVVLAPGSSAVAGQNLADMLASNAAAQATAVSGPVIQVSPLSLDFGVVNNGNAGTLTVTMTNTGDQPLQITGYAFSDALVYSSSSPTPSIPPFGGSATMVVRFGPEDGQSHPGSLMIASNASNGTQTVADTVSNWRNVAPCGN